MRRSEFDETEALMSLMMEVAARESALQQGQRIALPLSGDTEADDRRRRYIKDKLGTDPLDVEAMLDRSVAG